MSWDILELVSQALLVAVVYLSPLIALLLYHSLRRGTARREIFTQLLRTCARLQLPLHEALRRTSGAPREVARMMRRTAGELEQGASLGVALDGTWACIPTWYSRMVMIGESHGNLADVLDRVLVFDSRSEKIRLGMFERLLYPLMLLSMLTFILTGVVIYIIPSFVDMLEELGQDLPWATRALLTAVDLWMVFGWVPVLLGGWLLLIVVPYPWGRNWERVFWPWFWLKYRVRRFLPYVGKRYARAACGRWAATVSMLLDAGCNLPEAMQEAAEVESDPWFRKVTRRWQEQVQGGERLDAVLRRSRFVPRVLAWQVAGAEGGAHFATTLLQAGEYEVRSAVRDAGVVTRALTPCLVLIVGATVGLVALAMFQPLTAIMYHFLE